MRGRLLLPLVALCLARPARPAVVEGAEPAPPAGAASVSAVPVLSLGAGGPASSAAAPLAPAALQALALPAAAISPSASAVPAASLSQQMLRDAETYDRPFKTIDWKDGKSVAMGDRNPERIHRLVHGPDGRAVLVQDGRAREIGEGEKLNYVMFADGTMEAGVPSDEPFDFDARRGGERGVKHMQIADGREVVFAGELRRGGGALKIDLNSGGFSMSGLDPRWEYNARNTSLLKRYAEAILGEPVTVPAP